LPRVTTHTDICMIQFPAKMSRYRFAPECPELLIVGVPSIPGHGFGDAVEASPEQRGQ
jgi:hypothetical protein